MIFLSWLPVVRRSHTTSEDSGSHFNRSSSTSLMLHRRITAARQKTLEVIRNHYQRLYLPHVMLLPTARFGLYVVAKELLAPGDRVLISPVTCRTVISALLAAKTTPVFVDIDTRTGNIDASRLADSELNAARAIVTTNLYGTPDQVHELKSIATRRNLLLIEDCAHVLRTSVRGAEIGSVGDVSVFSFKKHFDEPGGVVCVRSENAATKIQRRIAIETYLPSAREEQLRFCQFHLEGAIGFGLTRRFSSAYRHLGAGDHRSARKPLAEPSSAPGVSLPTTATLLRMADSLEHWGTLIESRRAIARDLIRNCFLSVKSAPWADEVVFLAIPFFTEHRDAIASQLESHGIPIYFRYTPAMNRVFREGTERARNFDEGRIEHWCKSILPIQPRFGQQFLEILQPMAGNTVSSVPPGILPAADRLSIGN
jgi:DegT/DnrJ/EryC1/StrS aminotransferase family protein